MKSREASEIPGCFRISSEPSLKSASASVREVVSRGGKTDIYFELNGTPGKAELIDATGKARLSAAQFLGREEPSGEIVDVVKGRDETVIYLKLNGIDAKLTVSNGKATIGVSQFLSI